MMTTKPPVRRGRPPKYLAAQTIQSGNSVATGSSSVADTASAGSSSRQVKTANGRAGDGVASQEEEEESTLQPPASKKVKVEDVKNADVDEDKALVSTAPAKRRGRPPKVPPPMTATDHVLPVVASTSSAALDEPDVPAAPINGNKRRGRPPNNAAVSALDNVLPTTSAAVSDANDEEPPVPAASAVRRGRPPKKPVNPVADTLPVASVNPADTALPVTDDAGEDEPGPSTVSVSKGRGGRKKATASKLAVKMPATNGKAAAKSDSDVETDAVPPSTQVAQTADPVLPVKRQLAIRGARKQLAAPVPADDDVKEEESEDEPETSKAVVKQVTIKGKVPVDDRYPGADNVHVYCEGDQVWDAALNQTAIDTNNNKYYMIQLLEHDSRKQYVVHQRWGRVGNNGQQSATDCGGSLEKAKKEFEKKFHDKTKNKWEEREQFEKVAGKYDMILRDYEATDAPDGLADQPSGSQSLTAAPPKVQSKLAKPLQDLMGLIFNVKMMESQIMEMKYDANKAPLGKLTSAQIKLGYASLKKIAGILNLLPGQTPAAVNAKDLTDACNEYYTRIPHVFGMSRPTVINNDKLLKRELDLLETLGDIEVAMRAMKETLSSSECAIDHHYSTLKTTIQPISHDHEMFSLIQSYLTLTHGPTHSDYILDLLNVFTLEKDAPFRGDVGNRMLLWHGSRLSNFVGILSQGLRIAPPEAPVTGYMFGKGIYFADVSTKSANYCFSQSSDNIGMMLLCEVALGEPNELMDAKYDADQLPPGKLCTKGVGQFAPDASTYTTLQDGVKVPLGKCVDSVSQSRNRSVLQYNEYIVYDVAQVRMRYLVQVKFNYKRGRY